MIADSRAAAAAATVTSPCLFVELKMSTYVRTPWRRVKTTIHKKKKKKKKKKTRRTVAAAVLIIAIR